MQPRPTAAELLASVAELLERDIMPVLDGPVQHHARVAASLVAIVERELRLAPAAAAGELAAVQRLLEEAHVDARELPANQDQTTDLEQARSQLAAALRAGMADDSDVAANVWQVLMDVARDDLSISKPGHDSWGGD